MLSEGPRAPLSSEGERTLFSIGAASEKNYAKSEKNEDTLAAVPERGAFAVFDGMGGHEGGARAASLATETFLAGTELMKSHYKNFEDAAADVFLVAEEINKTIEREKRGPLNDMGATGAIGFFTRIGAGKSDMFFALHGGDVRIYAYDEKKLTALTTDNVHLKMPQREKKEKREIQDTLSRVENDEDFLKFTEGDAREAKALKKLFNIRRLVQNPFGHMTQTPELVAFKAPKGSRKLICSDGVHDNLTDPEIERILAETPDDEMAAKRLIEAAKARSRDAGHMRAKDDDITALVITVGGTPKRPERKEEAGRTLPGSDSGFRATLQSMDLGGPQGKEQEKAREPEPTMEEVLFNIRRIIAEEKKKPPASKASEPGDFASPKRPAPYVFPAAPSSPSPSSKVAAEEIPGLEKVTSLGELYSLILKNTPFEDLKRKGKISASDTQTSLIKLAGEIRAGKKSLDAFPEVLRRGLAQALARK